MRRRDFIAGLGGAAAWPLAARAQQDKQMRRVGWLDLFPESDPNVRARVKAFGEVIAQLGWPPGRKLAIEYRWGLFDQEGARSAATELLSPRNLDAILCGGVPATVAVQQVTNTVPIVFAIVSEPVALGIVPSLAHPGGNITGFTYLEWTIGGKWLELLRETAPQVVRIALMFNPESGGQSGLFYRSIEAAAARFSVKSSMAPVHAPSDIEKLMETLGREPRGGIICSADAFIYSNRALITELAARHRLPAIYGIPGRAAEGGLIYYGADIVDSYRKAAGYIDRILRGEKPADLPVQQPTKFRMGINMKTAAALGLTVPTTLLARADEVIE